MLFDEPGLVGSGGNSGFQATNIVAQFGANRILLVGFDMHTASGVHWHGPHGKNLINPSDVNLTRWRRVLDRAAETLRRLGIDVVNASPESALNAYPKMTIDQAMTRWGLTS